MRQLQNLVTDDTNSECYDLFLSESKNGATGGYCGSAIDRQVAELIYQKKAEKLLSDENCFKIFVVSKALCAAVVRDYINLSTAKRIRKYNAKTYTFNFVHCFVAVAVPSKS